MTITEVPAPTADAAVVGAWALYRRSQSLPWSGEVHRAQTRLMDLLEPHTRTGNSWGRPDVAAISAAAGDLAGLLARDTAEVHIAVRQVAGGAL